MAPVWATRDHVRGGVSEGQVGFPSWDRARVFRYEIRRWRGGIVPDAASAVDSPRRVSTSQAQASQVLELVPLCPVLTWGRDELRTGEMWNSNSLTSWLLTASGHDIGALRPPANGRAPGWVAGSVVAARTRTEC